MKNSSLLIDWDQKIRNNQFSKWLSKFDNKQLKVLDIGSGGGPYADIIIGKGHIYKSQDLCQLEISLLREGKYRKVDYVSDATNIPEVDNSFDLIICTEVLEHVPEPVLVISEINRLLKPGGEFFISFPSMSPAHQIPFYYSSGYSKYWVKYVSEKFDLSMEYCDYPTNSAINFVKLNIAFLALNFRLIKNVNLKSLILFPFLSISFVFNAIGSLVIDKDDKWNDFSYGLIWTGKNNIS
jgi:SAM-dependent methyltransferase